MNKRFARAGIAIAAATILFAAGGPDDLLRAKTPAASAAAWAGAATPSGAHTTVGHLHAMPHGPIGVGLYSPGQMLHNAPR